MVAIGAALGLASGCKRGADSAGQPRELRVLCGSSMAAPAQKVTALFETNSHARALLDFGGSETLLPRILSGAPADVFICHDPFEQKLKDAGHWAGSAVVGGLAPVLLVRPGNPHHLGSVADLAQPGLKVGIGDPRYSTCGEMFVKLLEQKGLQDQVFKQVVLQGRTHAEIANGLILGSLDAAVVWNFVARLYQGKVELVPTQDAYPRINVTVVGLKGSPNPELRDAFLALCRSGQVQAIFVEAGYVVTP
jgi:molybdate transport system substrate-binding protein